jgi:hypothetical protein
MRWAIGGIGAGPHGRSDGQISDSRRWWLLSMGTARRPSCQIEVPRPTDDARTGGDPAAATPGRSPAGLEAGDPGEPELAGALRPTVPGRIPARMRWAIGGIGSDMAR